jgi:hypothetical protein
MEVLMVFAVRRKPARIRVVAGLALVLAVLGVALSAASSATAAAPPGVKVFGHGIKVLAVFRSAKCVVGGPRSIAVSFRAVAKSQGWTLDVTFWKNQSLRSGSATYPVAFGPLAPIVVSVEAPDRRFFTTAYTPPDPPPTAGSVKLGPGGAIMGIGLFAVFAPDLQTGVALAGGLTCHYPRRGRRP